MARATRIALDMALETSKTLKPAIGIAWQYAKTEVVPPLTLNFFHGPKGKIIEENISKAADNLIAGIKNRIQEIEAEKIRELKRKEAAVKALAERLKVEAKKKAEEAKRKAEVIAKKLKAEAEKKAQTATTVVSEAKKSAQEAKQTITKKAVAEAKSIKAKKNKGENKQVSPRKSKK